MQTLTLKTRYPCCGRPGRFRAIVGVPREIYERRCSDCETGWHVERVTLSNKVNGVRIDRLEWLDTTTREFVRTYA